MQASPGNCQHIGARRSQQDAFGFSDKDDLAFVAHGGVLAVVADGMGGMSCGAEASHLAVQVFLHRYMSKRVEETVPEALLQALDDANQAVLNLSLAVGEAEVGTTLVAAVVHEDVLHWVGVGDSRLYLLRHGKLTQLTVDHVLAVALDRDAANGLISQTAAQNHPERLALTSYLGLNPIQLIDQNPHPLRLFSGDQILLCSDGLYAALDEAEIVAGFAPDPQLWAQALVALVLAKNRPGQDNLTVAMLATAADQQVKPHRTNR